MSTLRGRSAKVVEIDPNADAGAAGYEDNGVKHEIENGEDHTADPESDNGNGNGKANEDANTSASAEIKLPDSATINNNETHQQRLDRYLLSTDPQTEYRKHNSQDALKRFQYLLSLSPLFRHFIDTKATNDKSLHKLIRQIDRKTATGVSGPISDDDEDDDMGHVRQKGKAKSNPKSKPKNRRKRKSEKEEDAELMNNEEEEMAESTSKFLTESPNYVNGKLRDYQIQGLNWLISLYENRLSGILADEMGLGKTLQTISFLGYLRYYEKIDGPFLVIVPKSTLDNWRREFAKWTKDVNVVVLQGDKESRGKFINEVLMQANFDVCVTSFEMVIKEKAKLSKFRWQYMVIDEAHRIKNEQSSLSQIIRLFYSKNRLLITGTPLQNNLHELWALLNFLLPDVFGDSEIFQEWFERENKDENEDKGDDKEAVEKLRKILSPFLLRRVKSEVEKSLLPKIETNVYVGMTSMQLKWYRNLLQKDIEAVNGQVGKREGKTRLLNIVMQLRKCCNHPYLFDGAEPGPPYTNDEHLVFNAGKMIVLDKLLKKLKSQGSRVLIFSQMSRLLDILEDYCYLRDYEYCRIDGSTDHEDRVSAIDEYNSPDSDKFIFLLTTRAGGLGINLTTADVVVLFDSDWNPQADLQAMDRAHRIGQKKQVKVYRFITENAIEEKVLERAAQKLRLDQLVIQQGRSRHGDDKKDGSNNKEELLNMIQHGAQKVLDADEGSKSLDDDIDDILARGEERTRELKSKFEKLGLDDLQNFNGEQSSAYEWNGENFAKKKSKGLGIFLNPSKRVRKEQQYSVDGYYKDVMNQMKVQPNAKASIPRPPKQFTPYDFQFFDSKLSDLFDKELMSYRKRIGYTIGEEDLDIENKKYPDFDLEQYNQMSKKDQRNALSDLVDVEQEKIDECEQFTEEDKKQMEKFIEEGFGDWNKREFMQFIHGCAKYGSKNYEEISHDVKGKDELDVRRYSEVFWQRYKELDGWERYIKEIEIGERKLEKTKAQAEILRSKIKELSCPIEELNIAYPPNNSKRMYSLLEDRFLLIKADEYGMFNSNVYELIKRDILQEEMFRYCFYFKSRTTNELARRISTLLLAVSREVEGPDAFKRKRKSGKLLLDTTSTSVSRQDSADVDTEERVNGNNDVSTLEAELSSALEEGRGDAKRQKVADVSAISAAV
jgi:SWI/SNF-related matrix-associated actin-dependent regulator of chromatin subfamily A member 5